MNNYVYFAINSFIKAAHQNAVNGTPVSNSSSEPAGTIQLSATDDTTWTIDKTYQDLKTMYARGRLTGLSWHRSEDSIIFVPLTSTGMVDGHDSFVFSTILTTQGSSSFHSFIVPDEGEKLIYVTEDVGVETSFEVVEELVDGHPKVDSPSTKIIYLYKDSSSAVTDPYTEWIYTRDGEWEIIGETSLDLSDYSTTEQIAAEYYNKQEVNEKIGEASEDIGELREAKADKVESAVNGNFAGLDENGNLTDSGSKASDFKTKQSSVNVEGLGTTKTITALTQNANGEISASASDIRSASTSQTGIVQLNDSTDSASTSQAATANAVKKAYDHADTLVAGLDAEVTSDDGTNVQVKITQVDGIVTGVNITKDTSANAESVAQALAALDAEVTSSDGTNVQVKVTEVDGVVTAVNVTTDDTVNSTDVDTAVTSAIGDLDVSDLVQDSSGSMAGKTLLTLNESDGKIAATFQDIQITESQVTGLTDDLSSKVDKETGKSLSTNDYTDADKAKLEGVESGAQVNVIESLSVDGVHIEPDANKNVNLHILPAATAPDQLFTSTDGDPEWQQLEKSTWGTELTDTQGNVLEDENGNAVMDENAVDLWTKFNNVGFGAERAAADVAGNPIMETYATKEEVSSDISDLDAVVTSNDGTNVQVKVTEADGKISAVNITTDNTVNNTDLTNAINALDVDNITGLSVDKTITSLSETDGKISATAEAIQIAQEQVTRLPSDLDTIRNTKADKVANATNGNIAALDSTGNLTDSGIPAASGNSTVSLVHTTSGYEWDAWEQTDVPVPAVIKKYLGIAYRDYVVGTSLLPSRYSMYSTEIRDFLNNPEYSNLKSYTMDSTTSTWDALPTLDNPTVLNLWNQDKAFTLEVMFYTNNFGSGIGWCRRGYSDGGIPNLIRNSSFLVTCDNSRVQVWTVNNMSYTARATFPTYISSYAWHHIVVTYDSTSKICTIFIDGKIVGTVEITWTHATEETMCLCMGSTLTQAAIYDYVAYDDNFTVPTIPHIYNDEYALKA